MTGDLHGNSPTAQSNFAFLELGWPELYPEAAKAEQNMHADPRASCFYARRTLEQAVQWMYDADEALRRPYRGQLAALLFEPTFLTLVEPPIRTKMDVIRKQGNAAVHDNKRVTPHEAGAVVRELFHVLFWIAHTYARAPEYAPPASLTFDLEAIPRPTGAVARSQTREMLRKRAEAQAAQDVQTQEARRDNAELQAELARLRAEIAQAKAASQTRADEHDYDEADDPRLSTSTSCSGRPAGRSTEERDREFEVTGMPNEHGHRLRRLRALGRRRPAAGGGRGQAHHDATPNDGPAAGQALRRLPGAAVRPAAGDLLHQRLRDLAVGRRSGYPPRRCRASTPRTSSQLLVAPAHRAAPAGGHADQRRRSSSATTSTGRSGASARPSSATASARRCS